MCPLILKLKSYYDKKNFYFAGQRNHLVQTEEQYIFIHDAIVEAIRSGITEIKRQDVAQYVESLLKEAPQGDFEGIF